MHIHKIKEQPHPLLCESCFSSPVFLFWEKPTCSGDSFTLAGCCDIAGPCHLHRVTSDPPSEQRGWQANALFINKLRPPLRVCAVTPAIDCQISLCQLFNITNCWRVAKRRPSVSRVAFHCVLSVNMQEVNAGVPVMPPRVHFAWLGAVLELVRWKLLHPNSNATSSNSTRGGCAFRRYAIRWKMHHMHLHLTSTLNSLFISEVRGENVIVESLPGSLCDPCVCARVRSVMSLR